MKGALVFLAVCLNLVVVSACCWADLKVHYKIKEEKTGKEIDRIVYFRNSKKRVEDISPAWLTSIFRCDDKTSYLLSSKYRLYVQQSVLNDSTVPSGFRSNMPPQEQRPSCGIIRLRSVEEDLGLRRTILGVEARKAKLTYEWVPDSDSCTQMRGSHVIEGWFIPVPEGVCPEIQDVLAARARQSRDQVIEEPKVLPERLIPVEATRTVTDRGEKRAVYSINATEISTEPLPDGLFAVPADFRKGASVHELLTGQATEGMVPGTSEPVYGPGSNVARPQIITRISPALSTEERRKAHGEVRMTVIIGSDGLVKDVKMVKSIDPQIDAKCMEAVRNWTFRPATKDGKPVAYQMGIGLAF